MEVKTHPTHPLTKAIPRFIQLLMPLPPLHAMAQPPEYALPHPLIEPSVLRAAKALVVE
jgi:hypothetical protein